MAMGRRYFYLTKKGPFNNLSFSSIGINVACTTASEERIFRALFRSNSDVHFVTAGVKHLKFWSVAGNTLVEKKAVITQTTDGRRSTKMQTMLSIAFGSVNFFLIKFI
jgi:microtubule-associated protein-like 6